MPLYLITGASSGIGLNLTQQLLDKGNKVVAISRSASPQLEELQKVNSTTLTFLPRDLSTDISGLSKWIKDEIRPLGKLSGITHCAGAMGVAPLRYATYEEYLKLFNLNLFSALEISKVLTDKRLKEKSGCSIVFISSIASISGSKGIALYSSTKAALNGAMRSLAKEMAGEGVRVNSVLPGLVHTELVKKNEHVYTREYLEKMEKIYPLGTGKVEDVANAILFLLGPESRWITGTELIVDGGASLGQFD